MTRAKRSTKDRRRNTGNSGFASQLAAERGGTTARETFMNGTTNAVNLRNSISQEKKHLGEYDPVTGAQTKPQKPGRTTPKG
jgi:hypothetical protein